MSLTKHNRWVC